MSEIPIKAMKYDDANKDPHQFYPLTVPEAIIFPDGTNGKQAFDAVINDMSDVFSDQKPYEVGDYCIYNNVLYKFIAQKTAGVWDSSKASVTTIDAELKSLLNQINTLNSGMKIVRSSASLNAEYLLSHSNEIVHGLLKKDLNQVGYSGDQISFAFGFSDSWAATIIGFPYGSSPEEQFIYVGRYDFGAPNWEWDKISPISVSKNTPTLCNS